MLCGPVQATASAPAPLFVDDTFLFAPPMHSSVFYLPPTEDRVALPVAMTLKPIETFEEQPAWVLQSP
jgi:hypothetical protein